MFISWFARLDGLFHCAVAAALLCLSFGIQHVVFVELVDVAWLAAAVVALLIACRLTVSSQAQAGRPAPPSVVLLRLVLMAVALLSSFAFFVFKLKSVGEGSWAGQLTVILRATCGVQTSDTFWLMGCAGLLAVALELAIAVTLAGLARRYGPLFETQRQFLAQRRLKLMQAHGELDLTRLESVLVRRRVAAAERELDAQLAKADEIKP